MNLSFAKTRKQFEDGVKTCSRRFWKARHLEMWQRAFDSGKLIHDGWSNLPYVHGSESIGKFRLTCRPYLERLADMPESDLKAEGGLCATREEFYQLIGGKADDVVAVIRFERI